MRWSRGETMQEVFWEQAVEDMAIYCRAVVRDGVEIPRTEWQDGWNAAVIGISERRDKIEAWWSKLTDAQRAALEELVKNDVLSLRIREDAVILRAHCGDTFAYACADSEDITLDEIPEFARLWKAHGYVGMVAFIAQKRAAEPVKEYRFSADYLKARADIAPRVPTPTKEGE